MMSVCVHPSLHLALSSLSVEILTIQTHTPSHLSIAVLFENYFMKIYQILSFPCLTSCPDGTIARTQNGPDAKMITAGGEPAAEVCAVALLA